MIGGSKYIKLRIIISLIQYSKTNQNNFNFKLTILFTFVF